MQCTRSSRRTSSPSWTAPPRPPGLQTSPLKRLRIRPLHLQQLKLKRHPIGPGLMSSPTQVWIKITNLPPSPLFTLSIILDGRNFHRPKYNTLLRDPRLSACIVNTYGRPDLLSSAYADSSWNKILSARNCFDRFEHENFSVAKSWPISQDTIKLFVEWCIFKQQMTASTVRSYIHCIGILHKLKNMDNSSCNSFITKLILRGAENLEFYKPKSSLDRRVMMIPLLRIILLNVMC
jgi:hypothetical protein